MSTIEIIRLIIGGLFIAVGIFFVIVATIGVYRIGNMINRMHASSMCDTMGVFCTMIGQAILLDFGLVTAKVLLLIVFVWLTSPISSFFLGRVEYETNPSFSPREEE